MAYTDPNYKFLSGGSTVSTASGLTGLFGNVSSLSQINANEVILLMLSASGGDASIYLGPGSTSVGAFRLTSGASIFDVPPITAVNASQITFAREGANNPVIFWTIVVRNP